jgi:predicted dehydrogenase
MRSIHPSPDGRYTAALIGAGRIGMMLEADPKRVKPATHFGMWTTHPKTRLDAVCDSDPEKLTQATALSPGVRTFTNPERLLAEARPDLVSIATWKDSHYAMMKLALKHGVPVIVLEKPIAEAREHAQEIVEEAAQKGIHILVNHRRRFDPLLHTLREELRQGLIGELLQVTCYYVFGLVTTGTHLVDTLRMLLKDVAGEVSWVSAMPNALPTFHPADDPNIDGFIGFESGLKAAVQSLSMKDYDLFEFHFFGRRGRVVFKNVGRDIEIYRVIESGEHQGFTELENVPSERRGGAPRNLFRLLADNAVSCLEGQTSSLSTGEDSLKALEVLLAMHRSAAAGGSIVRLGDIR